MVRPGVIAQYYRRGKSLGRRDFSSSSGGNKSDVVDLAGSVMETLYPYGLGLAFGTGSTALFSLIFGCSNLGKAEEIEKEWETKQLKLDQLDRLLEEDRKSFGEIRKQIAELKGELKSA